MNDPLWGPVDLANWRDTPCISGRIAVEADVNAGRAVFFLAGASAKPHPLDLPCCALLAAGTGPRKPVIVIQAESTDRGIFVGYRALTGGNGVGNLDELALLPGPDASFQDAAPAPAPHRALQVATPELAHAIRTLLASGAARNPAEQRLAQRFQALPVGPDLFREVLLRPDGEVLRVEAGVPEERSRNASDQLRVLVLAAARYPTLARFIPEKPPGAPSCPFCEGRDLGWCPGCFGLGWVP
ncbi:MAG TPA: hypothetical protein VJ826_12525 [Candidatus Polarisedimenticolaceae bacterium]|nr:hypothetical protein [Candidatus Polarisedimenticolaceae bacterium]